MVFWSNLCPTNRNESHVPCLPPVKPLFRPRETDGNSGGSLVCGVNTGFDSSQCSIRWYAIYRFETWVGCFMMLKTVASAKLLILSISISLYVNVYAIHIHTSEITANFSLNTPWFVNYLKVGRKHNIQIFIYNISVCIYIYIDLPWSSHIWTKCSNINSRGRLPASSTVRFLDALHLLDRVMQENTIHLFWEWFGVNV